MTYSINGWQAKDTEPGTYHYLVGFEGTGANNPTRLIGRGITITRQAAVGKYRVTFADGPGTFVDAKYAFQATTPSDVAGYSVAFGDYNVASKYIDVWVYDGANALDDLEAGWKLRLEFTFKTVDA
jgi:hypothetical protein